MKFIIRMYNKNGCGLSIGAWHVGVFIMVPKTGSKKLRPMSFVHMLAEAGLFLELLHLCLTQHLEQVPGSSG